MSNRRQKQAAATRQDILLAARTLFGERGYASTSMALIAAEAGTAVQTIYDSVGPKKAIVLAIMDVLEVEAGVPEIMAELRETNDPRTMIALQVRLQRQFYERCGDILKMLITGAAQEPAIAATLAVGQSRNRATLTTIIERIHEMGALRGGLSLNRARGTLDVLTWMTCAEYVEGYDWSYDEFQEWLTDDLCRLLLRNSD
ncbi:MAG: TetR/AcrR family transcriptional regulator [Thermomicrobiales bacterium]|nr:TetR/AcrR family transcriptional regulator [Thermomicrobiales bacterium]MCO5223019.1 TetR/AcrR family transcriptional regulator [Thermomicrobiales bacterium]